MMMRILLLVCNRRIIYEGKNDLGRDCGPLTPSYNLGRPTVGHTRETYCSVCFFLFRILVRNGRTGGVETWECLQPVVTLPGH